MVKWCAKCLELKPLAQFSKSRQKSDGRDARCKLCRKLYPGVRKPRAYKPSPEALLRKAAPELLEALLGLMTFAEPFTSMPIGSPGSAKRLEQEAHIAAFQRAQAAVIKAKHGSNPVPKW